MRSHVIVFVVVAAAALIFVLARQGSETAPATALSEPVIAIERGTRASAVEVASESPSTSAATVAEPASVPTTVRKAQKRITTCTLGGYVLVEGEERVPVSRAYIGLFRPAVGADPFKVAFGQWTGPAEARAAQHQLLTWTYSGDDGKFEFDELLAGTYFLRVELGPLVVRVCELQELAPSEVRAGLVILLPVPGGLNGTILAPPGVDFEAWQAGLQRKDPIDPPFQVDGIPIDMLKHGIEADGTFHLGPAEAGPHTVWLVAKQEPNSRRPLAKILIGEVNIVAGEDVERVFDLRDGFPGSLRVTLNVPALDGTNLGRNPLSHTITAVPRFGGPELQSVSANCAAGSTTVVGPLLPGPWTVSVRSNMAPWVYQSDRTENVLAAQTCEVTLDVPLYAGTLTCLDSVTGAPISEGDVMIEPLNVLEKTGRSEFTDEKGLVRLLLVKGTYSVSAFGWDEKGFDKAIAETIEWREDGPHPQSVKLLPAATSPR